MSAVERELDGVDYYRLLGVDQTASTDEVKRAFHAFALRYHPDRLAKMAVGERARAEDVYRRGAEAYRVLSKPAKRKLYDEQLAAGKLRYESGATSGGKKPAGHRAPLPPRARPFAAKADAAIKAGDLKAARLNLRIAITNCGGTHEALEAKLAEIEAQLRG